MKKRLKKKTKTLDAHLYCYVQRSNAKWAKAFGTKIFGSQSAYINALIAKDRGVKPKLGTWKVAGENKK